MNKTAMKNPNANPKVTLTQKEKILSHLQTGQTLTSWQCWRLWKITRLAAHIRQLRKEGHEIKSDTVPPTNYAIYTLIRDLRK